MTLDEQITKKFKMSLEKKKNEEEIKELKKKIEDYKEMIEE